MRARAALGAGIVIDAARDNEQVTRLHRDALDDRQLFTRLGDPNRFLVIADDGIIQRLVVDEPFLAPE